MRLRSKWRDFDFAAGFGATGLDLTSPNKANVTNIKTDETQNSETSTPRTSGDVSDIRSGNGEIAENAQVTLAPLGDVSWPSANDVAERTAIVAEGAGVPEEWATGFARMCAMPAPEGFTDRQWQEAIDGAGRFIDEWATKAAAFGWSAEEIFGAHPIAPMADYSMRGLALSLRAGERIVAITQDTAVIENSRGKRLTFYRENVQPGGVPVWLRPMNGGAFEKQPKNSKGKNADVSVS